MIQFSPNQIINGAKDRYQIIKKIGQGAISEVFYAVNVLTQEEVAIKIMTQHRIGDLQMNLYYESEVEIAIKLSKLQQKCENVANIIESHFIVFEFCQHGNLNDNLLLNKGMLSEEVKLLYCLYICQGLCFLHKQNLVHRDLKPDNILIREKNNEFFLKITDFGLSKLQDLDQYQSQVGTIIYMAPEIIQGKNYNQKVDVWSLGCIMDEIFRGEILFYDNTTQSVSNKIINFKDLIKKCLIVNPQDRIDSQQLLQEIKELIRKRSDSQISQLIDDDDNLSLQKSHLIQEALMCNKNSNLQGCMSEYVFSEKNNQPIKAQLFKSSDLKQQTKNQNIIYQQRSDINFQAEKDQNQILQNINNQKLFERQSSQLNEVNPNYQKPYQIQNNREIINQNKSICDIYNYQYSNDNNFKQINQNSQTNQSNEQRYNNQHNLSKSCYQIKEQSNLYQFQNKNDTENQVYQNHQNQNYMNKNNNHFNQNQENIDQIQSNSFQNVNNQYLSQQNYSQNLNNLNNGIFNKSQIYEQQQSQNQQFFQPFIQNNQVNQQQNNQYQENQQQNFEQNHTHQFQYQSNQQEIPQLIHYQVNEQNNSILNQQQYVHQNNQYLTQQQNEFFNNDKIQQSYDQNTHNQFQQQNYQQDNSQQIKLQNNLQSSQQQFQKENNQTFQLNQNRQQNQKDQYENQQFIQQNQKYNENNSVKQNLQQEQSLKLNQDSKINKQQDNYLNNKVLSQKQDELKNNQSKNIQNKINNNQVCMYDPTKDQNIFINQQQINEIRNINQNDLNINKEYQYESNLVVEQQYELNKRMQIKQTLEKFKIDYPFVYDDKKQFKFHSLEIHFNKQKLEEKVTYKNKIQMVLIKDQEVFLHYLTKYMIWMSFILFDQDEKPVKYQPQGRYLLEDIICIIMNHFGELNSHILERFKNEDKQQIIQNNIFHFLRLLLHMHRMNSVLDRINLYINAVDNNQFFEEIFHIIGLIIQNHQQELQHVQFTNFEGCTSEKTIQLYQQKVNINEKLFVFKTEKNYQIQFNKVQYNKLNDLMKIIKQKYKNNIIKW